MTTTTALNPSVFATQVIDLLRQRFELKPPIDAPVLHLLENPGKCLRPELAFAVAEACGRSSKPGIFAVATAAELLHLASLVHDDLVDDSSKRHSAQSVHQRFDAKTAVLTGDYLIGVAHSLLAKDAAEATLRSIGPAMHSLAEAELTELITRGHETTPEIARKIAIGKAGSLFAWVATASAIECNEWAGEAAWNTWGLQLGLLYQLSNQIGDHLEIEEGKDTGKNVATDTLTLLRILLSEENGLSLLVSEIERLIATVRRPPAMGTRLVSFIDYVAGIAADRAQLLADTD